MQLFHPNGEESTRPANQPLNRLDGDVGASSVDGLLDGGLGGLGSLAGLGGLFGVGQPSRTGSAPPVDKKKEEERRKREEVLNPLQGTLYFAFSFLSNFNITKFQKNL